MHILLDIVAYTAAEDARKAAERSLQDPDVSRWIEKYCRTYPEGPGGKPLVFIVHGVIVQPGDETTTAPGTLPNLVTTEAGDNPPASPDKDDLVLPQIILNRVKQKIQLKFLTFPPPKVRLLLSKLYSFKWDWDSHAFERDLDTAGQAAAYSFLQAYQTPGEIFSSPTQPV